jgi:hypothetical protein
VTPEGGDPPDPLDGLRALLAREGGTPSPQAERTVAALEERYGIRIPADFRNYLLHVAPLQDVMDGEMTNWFSLDRVRSIPDELAQFSTTPHAPSTHPGIAAEESAYLVFADYMIWCWGWAVCCSDGPNRGRVALITGDDGFVAASFTEFVERYLRDPPAMANTFPPPWREKGATMH